MSAEDAIGGAASGAATGASIGSVIPGIGTAIGAGVGALGGLLGNLFSGGKRKAAEKAQAEALAQIQAVGAPPDLAKQIMLEKFQSAGLYSPKLEDAVNQTVSQVANIQEDPSLKNAQMGALQSLQQRGRTGLSATDRAALNQERGEVQRDAEAKRQQIIQNAQMRGQAGSGTELAAQLAAAQGGADSQSAAGDRIAAMAQQNALNAIGQAGSLGGQIRGQDFDVNKTKASAADEMNRFNIQNAINRQQRNVGNQNQAQQANLANQQGIMNANTAQNNTEALRQAQAARQNWADKLTAAQVQAGALTGQANTLNQQAADQSRGFQQIGSGIGAGFGALSNYLNSKPATPKPPTEDNATGASTVIPQTNKNGSGINSGY